MINNNILKTFSFFLGILLLGCNTQHFEHPHVLINTGYGDIEIELYEDAAPKTVAAFLRYVDDGLYNESNFYRVLKSEDQPTDFNTGIIQGGIYNATKKSGKSFTPLVHESSKQTGLSHTDGTISFASNGAGTATTEFFICIGDQSPLDEGRRGTKDGKGFAAFGKVIKGMSVVRKIQSLKSIGDAFVEPVEINEIVRVGG